MSSDNALDIQHKENEQLDYLYQEQQALKRHKAREFLQKWSEKYGAFDQQNIEDYYNSKEYKNSVARHHITNLQKSVAKLNSRPNPFNDSRNDDPSFYMRYE